MLKGEIRDISFRYSQKGNQMFRISIHTESDIKDKEWINVYLNKTTPTDLIDMWWDIIGASISGKLNGVPYSWLQFATTKSFELIGIKVKMEIFQEDGWDGWKVKTVVPDTDVPQEKVTEAEVAEVQKELAPQVIPDDDIPF